MVPDVIRRALEPSFTVTAADSRRCGPMLRAQRTRPPEARS